MFNNHVGRPTNEDVAKKKRIKMLKILIPVIGIAVVAILIVSKGSLSSLMGQTMGVCEEGYAIIGNNCVRETNAYLLGDVNNDQVIDDNDLNYLNQNKNELGAIDKEKFDDYQLAVSDINKDGDITLEDINEIAIYIKAVNIVNTEAYYSEKIGKEYVCPVSTDETKYELKDNKCFETKGKNNQVVSIGSQDDEGGKNPEESKELGIDEIFTLEEPEKKEDIKYGTTLNYKLNVNDNNDYYYIQSSYYNEDIKNYESECTLVNKNNPAKATLAMNQDSRKIVFDIYSDSACTQSEITKESEIYTLADDQNLLQELSDRNININDNIIVELSEPEEKEYSEPVDLFTYWTFNIKDDKTYYSNWNTVVDDKQNATQCVKVVNGMTQVHRMKLTGNKVKGINYLYSDNKCTNLVSSNLASSEYNYQKNTVNTTSNNNGSATIAISGPSKTKIYKFNDIITIKVKKSLTGNQKYYYKFYKYYSNTKNFSKKKTAVSSCRELKEGTDEIKLNMISDYRSVGYIIYEGDNTCTQKSKIYKKNIESKVYRLDSKEKLIYEKNKRLSNSDNDIKINIVEPAQKELSKGTTINFETQFDGINNINNYSYKYALYINGASEFVSDCHKVENGLKPIYSTKINNKKVNAKVYIYKNKNCSGKSSLVGSTSIYHAMVEAKPKSQKCDTGYTLKKSQKGNYYCYKTQVPKFSCKTTGYSVTSYESNKNRRYCRKNVGANISSYTCSNIGGTLSGKTCLNAGFNCSTGGKKGNNCYVNIAKNTTVTVKKCPSSDYTEYNKSECIQKQSKAVSKIYSYYCPKGTENKINHTCEIKIEAPSNQKCSGDLKIRRENGKVYCYANYGSRKLKSSYCPPISGKYKEIDGKCPLIVSKISKTLNKYKCNNVVVDSKNNSRCQSIDNTKKKYYNVAAQPIYSCKGIKGANGDEGKLFDGNKCKLVDSATVTCPSGKKWSKKQKSDKSYYCLYVDTDIVKYTCPDGYKKIGTGVKTSCLKEVDK